MCLIFHNTKVRGSGQILPLCAHHKIPSGSLMKDVIEKPIYQKSCFQWEGGKVDVGAARLADAPPSSEKEQKAAFPWEEWNRGHLFPPEFRV